MRVRACVHACLCASVCVRVCVCVYLHLAGVPAVLERFDPADVWDVAVQEGAGLAHEHAQRQRRPVRLWGGQGGRDEKEEEVETLSPLLLYGF